MDPWADTSAAWSPTEVVRPVASPQISKGPSSPYHEGPADPWAEPSHVAASIPIVTSGSEHRRPSSDDDISAGEEVPGGDFDPWGGNSAPLAPIAADLPTSTPIRPEDVDLSPRKDTSENRGWSEDSSKEEARDPRHGQVESFGEDMVVGDDADPWGSGAAARHVKAQQEAEAVSHLLSY